MSELQQPVFPAELAAALGIQIKTLARMIKAGRVPPPDVRLTAKTRYWHRATLVDKNLIV
jgi:predicted site-specific integrase-resolvase